MTVSPQQHGRLSAEQSRLLGTSLTEFERSWDEKRLGAKLRELPPAGDPLRLPLLLGLVRIDLRRRWQLGHKVTVESYLKACPELGTPQTVPVALIEAEYQARLECGAPSDRAELARRFPTRTAELQQLFDCPTASIPSPTGSPADLGNTQGGSGTCPRIAPDGDAPLPEQFGRYRIHKPLGQGGMGTVYLAQDTQLDRRVALKVPRFTAGDGPHVKERFFREARAAATIEHPNICPVYDVGEIAGTHYLAMAYIEGRSLADLLRGGKPMAERQAAALVRKLALALAEAHHRGIVHRDLKPSNIMINQRGEPVIMDFGLARQLNQEESRLTQQGAILGTPAYMSPEQVEGDVDALGPGCDIYSLGVILYELLAGQVPFQGSMTSVLAKVLTAQPRPLQELRAGLNPVLEAVCAKAMAKDPADRYGSMRQFAAALFDVLHGEETTKQLPPPAPEADAEAEEAKETLPQDEGPSKEEETPRRGKRSRKRRTTAGKRSGTPAWLWAVAGAAVAVGLLVVVLLVLSALRRGHPAPDAVAAAPEPPPQPAAQPAPRPAEKSSEWQLFYPPGGRCSVLMPGLPKYDRQVAKTADGDLITYTHNLQYGDQHFRVSYTDLPGFVLQGEQAETALNSGRDGLLKARPTAKLLRESNISVEGFAGREWQMETAKGGTLLTVRSFIVRQRMYFLSAETPPGAPAGDREKFLTSFQLLPP
jgi:serine/threonine protein kinase